MPQQINETMSGLQLAVMVISVMSVVIGGIHVHKANTKPYFGFALAFAGAFAFFYVLLQVAMTPKFS